VRGVLGTLDEFLLFAVDLCHPPAGLVAVPGTGRAWHGRPPIL
jgi:hypothetical protein